MGLESGPVVYWYPNGQKKLEVNYKNGLKEGVERQWDAAGILISTKTFKKGRLVN
jgi:antitoxin component YwqK of YwqJK toxin-antitoxin module